MECYEVIDSWYSRGRPMHDTPTWSHVSQFNKAVEPPNPACLSTFYPPPTQCTAKREDVVINMYPPKLDPVCGTYWRSTWTCLACVGAGMLTVLAAPFVNKVYCSYLVIVCVVVGVVLFFAL